MSRKNDYNYFNAFISMVECSCEAAKLLNKILSNFDSKNLPEYMNQMHEIEHSSDNIQHKLTHQLAKEFLPPIDREDIISLSHQLDDITDSIEDVLLKLYIFNIVSIREEALVFSNRIVDCCEALKLVTEEFSNYKRSGSIGNLLIKIDTIEEECDNLYANAVRKLYTETPDALDVLTWSEVLDCFEKCPDTCEHVAHEIEIIIIKNT